MLQQTKSMQEGVIGHKVMHVITLTVIQRWLNWNYNVRF